MIKTILSTDYTDCADLKIWGKMKRLFIDLEICYKCKECVAECSYFYHPENNGVVSLLELVSKVEVCRRCEAAPCVEACVFDALEKQPDGSLKRYSMLCTGCQTCSLACPFGVIYPEIVPYITSQCDYCVGRCNGNEPECVKTCPHNAIKYIEVEESKENDIYLVGEHLAVHSIPWRKE